MSPSQAAPHPSIHQRTRLIPRTHTDIHRRKKGLWRRQIFQAFISAVFDDGEIQPKRETYFKFGTLDESDWNPAEMVSATA